MTYTYKYPRPALTVDALVFTLNREILLIQRSAEPFKNMWAFPGGFVDENETAENAVRRELKEETGITIDDFKQLHTFTNPNRDPRHRTVTIAYTTIIDDKVEAKAGDDAAAAKWFNLDDLPSLAFDHDEILNFALERIDVKRNS